MTEENFVQKVFPALKANQKNQILFVYIDSSFIELYEAKVEDIPLPQFANAWTLFLTEYSKYHGLKKSRVIDIEKTKAKGDKKELMRFRFKPKPDKKPTINKSRPKDVGRQLLSSRYFLRRISQLLLRFNISAPGCSNPKP